VFFLLPETKGDALDGIQKMFMQPRKWNALNAAVSPASEEKWRSEKVYDNGDIESEDEEEYSQVAGLSEIFLHLSSYQINIKKQTIRFWWSRIN
jgi:hypothetical protein